MIRLDRAALDYLLKCCCDIGFEATNIQTLECEVNAPTLEITFRQSRIAETPKAPSPERDPLSGQAVHPGDEQMLDGTTL